MECIAPHPENPLEPPRSAKRRGDAKSIVRPPALGSDLRLYTPAGLRCSNGSYGQVHSMLERRILSIVKGAKKPSSLGLLQDVVPAHCAIRCGRTKAHEAVSATPRSKLMTVITAHSATMVNVKPPHARWTTTEKAPMQLASSIACSAWQRPPTPHRLGESSVRQLT